MSERRMSNAAAAILVFLLGDFCSFKNNRRLKR
jgi:hypothetical protein